MKTTITVPTMMAANNPRKLYFICFTIALGGLLFGFDTAVISGTIALLKTQFALSAAMEGWLVSSGLLGCIIGILVTGVLSDRIGRKKTIVLSGIMFFLSGMGCAFATDMNILIIARIVGGVGVGMASVISPMVIAEFAPAAERGRMISFYQLAITVGILLAYLSNALLLHYAKGSFESGTMQWFFQTEVWRPMFLAMCLPAALFLILLAGVPESPRWLISIGKTDKAKAILEHLKTAEVAARDMAVMVKGTTKSAAQNVSLFSPNLRLPLIVGVVLAVFQQFSGINAIIYYGPGIFTAAGIDASNALLFQLIIGMFNLIFTLVAIKYADKYGRKFLLRTGLTGIVISLVLIGILFYSGHTQSIWLLVLMLVYIACFAFSLGPVTWIIISEIFPTAVRVKAVSVCTMALWIAVWMVGQFFPWLLATTGPAFTFWLFAGFSIMNFIFCQNVVKETSGKTLEEMDEVFVAPH